MNLADAEIGNYQIQAYNHHLQEAVLWPSGYGASLLMKWISPRVFESHKHRIFEAFSYSPAGFLSSDSSTVVDLIGFLSTLHVEGPDFQTSVKYPTTISNT